MHIKYEIFTKFKEFKDLFKKQIDYRIRVLRYDNGVEYWYNKFDEFVST